MDAQHSIDEAIAHLGAALIVSNDTDEPIIIKHVHDAHELLRSLHSAHSSRRSAMSKTSGYSDAELLGLWSYYRENYATENARVLEFAKAVAARAA